MNKPTGIPVLRKDALVPVELGTGFIKRLYELSMFIIADKTPEQIDALHAALKQGPEAVDQELWMKHYMTVMSLLQAAEETAIAKNLVDYKDPSELDS